MSLPLAMAYDETADEMFWEGAGGCESRQGAKLYLEAFPEGRYATEAAGCIAWEEVKGCEDKAAVEEFLENYPKSRNSQDARACLALLEEQERQNVLIERLLTECRAHYDSHRLTTGSGGNALDCYRRVLDHDPGNADALAGIAKIEEQYVDKAKSALDSFRPDVVLRWVERLEAINPEHPQVEELRTRTKQLRARLAAEEELRQDVESYLDKGMIGRARSRLEAGRKLGLDSKLVTALEDQIRQVEDEAEQVLREGVFQVQTLLESDRVLEARAKFEELVGLGLDDERRAELESALAQGEARALAAQIEELLGKCQDHIQSVRLAEALVCYRQVLKLDGNHAEATAEVNRLVPLVAWQRADSEKTVEGYFRFEQSHPNSVFASLARHKLDEMEVEYWQSIEGSDDTSKHLRYLEIYPDGRFVALARSRSSGEE